MAMSQIDTTRWLGLQSKLGFECAAYAQVYLWPMSIRHISVAKSLALLGAKKKRKFIIITMICFLLDRDREHEMVTFRGGVLWLKPFTAISAI